MAGAGSAKLSYVLLQKLLKLAEFLPRRRDPAADSTPAGTNINSVNGNTGNGNSSNGDIRSGIDSNGNSSSGVNSNGNSTSGNSSGNSGGGNGGGGFCFKYVITDFSHANFGFWMNHPRLQELFTLGIIDFAVFDAEASKGRVGGVRPGQAEEEEEGRECAPGATGESDDRPGGEPGVGLWGSGCLRLELSGEEIRPGDLENPVLVVANYVFDSLKQDAFR